MIITLSDARSYGGCITGWKSFCEIHGFDWKDVVRNGLTEEQLLSTKDIMAENLVNYVLTRDK